jgi:hypothetical protein
MLWSVFDIRVTLPETLKLNKFRFDAGKFELEFIRGKQSIFLHRWAPAAVLLSGGDLARFAGTVPGFSEGQPQSLKIGEHDAVEWRQLPVSDWQRIVSRLKISPSFFWYRLWHVAEKNRILGIRSESRYPFEFQLLDQIYKDYESI